MVEIIVTKSNSVLNVGLCETDYLKHFFKNGKNCDNFILFSTSGGHGSYTTIESIEEDISILCQEEINDYLTFVIIQPRIVSMIYGNVKIESIEDIEYLKRLREESLTIISKIGF